MTHEDEIATRLAADTTLMATLTGGVFKSGTVGREGITRETAPTAFSGGYLLPCALVKQRGNVPDGIVQDFTDQATSAVQVVEVWLYEDAPGYTNIDAAKARLFRLLQGYPISDGFEIRLALELDRQRDNGALNGASMERRDWQVNTILGG